MCFPGPSKNDVFRSQDRSRTPKNRRIDFFNSFLAPPLAHFGATWAPLGLQRAPFWRPVAPFWQPWGHPGIPRDPPGTPRVNFHRFFIKNNGFWLHFSLIVWLIVQRFFNGFLLCVHLMGYYVGPLNLWIVGCECVGKSWNRTTDWL